MTVDTGVSAVGWALWRWDTRVRNEPDTPIQCGNIKPPTTLRGDTFWVERALWLANETLAPLSAAAMRRKAKRMRTVRPVDLLVLEWPTYRGDATGHSAAAKGDLQRLCFMAGALASRAAKLNWAVELVTPGEWKGQLSKDTVELRINRAIGNVAQDGSKIESHAADAVGMGLWRKGFKFSHEIFKGNNG